MKKFLYFILVLLVLGIGIGVVSYFMYPGEPEECKSSGGGSVIQITAWARHPLLFWWKKEFGLACQVPKGWVMINNPQ